MADYQTKVRENGEVEEDDIHGEIFDLHFLPEGCIAAVISSTTPRDACRLASVSKIFKSASDSDTVWENFLPPDYPEILARSDGGLSLLNSLSKKQLFMHLADRHLLIDGGILSFSLEKSTGKKCYTIAARDLHISWGYSPKYWTWNSVPYSRFAEVAELRYVRWHEIRGRMKTSILSPNTNYVAYFIFNMTKAANGFHSSAEMEVKTTDGKTKIRIVRLNPKEGKNDQRRSRYPVVHRGDGWMEAEIGEFFIRGNDDDDGEVEMSVLEVKSGYVKQGLVVEGIEIRPKMVNNNRGMKYYHKNNRKMEKY